MKRKLMELVRFTSGPQNTIYVSGAPAAPLRVTISVNKELLPDPPPVIRVRLEIPERKESKMGRVTDQTVLLRG